MKKLLVILIMAMLVLYYASGSLLIKRSKELAAQNVLNEIGMDEFGVKLDKIHIDGTDK